MDLESRARLVTNPVRLTILDLFDLSPVGEGRKRTSAYCPEGYDGSGDQQVDRFAAALMARQILEGASDARIEVAIRQLQDVVASGGEDLGQRVTFPCERTRGNFDFDPTHTVDVVIGDTIGFRVPCRSFHVRPYVTRDRPLPTLQPGPARFAEAPPPPPSPASGRGSSPPLPSHGAPSIPYARSNCRIWINPWQCVSLLSNRLKQSADRGE